MWFICQFLVMYLLIFCKVNVNTFSCQLSSGLVNRDGRWRLQRSQFVGYSTAARQISDCIGRKFKGRKLETLVEAILKVKGYETNLCPEGTDGAASISWPAAEQWVLSNLFMRSGEIKWWYEVWQETFACLLGGVMWFPLTGQPERKLSSNTVVNQVQATRLILWSL